MSSCSAQSFSGEQRQVKGQTCHAVNVGDTERVISILGGGALALAGVRRLDSLSGIVLSAIGGCLVYRGISGHCQLYDELNVSTAGGASTAVPAGHGAHVEKSIYINCRPEKMFSFWRHFENLPRFMKHLVSVEHKGSNVTHWVAKAPLGATVEWDAELMNVRQNELIAWRSLPGSQVSTAGSVRFESGPAGRGTNLTVNLKYDPPAGRLGVGVARLFGEDPATQIEADLKRLKEFCETGEIPTTEGQPSGRNPTPLGSNVPEHAPGMHAGLRRDSVGEDSLESFPASDPPSWTSKSTSNTGLGGAG